MNVSVMMILCELGSFLNMIFRSFWNMPNLSSNWKSNCNFNSNTERQAPNAHGFTNNIRLCLHIHTCVQINQIKALTKHMHFYSQIETALILRKNFKKKNERTNDTKKTEFQWKKGNKICMKISHNCIPVLTAFMTTTKII